MFPKDGKYVCRNSDYEEDIKASATIKSNTPAGEDVAVVGEDVVALPKTRVICPECGNEMKRDDDIREVKLPGYLYFCVDRISLVL